MIVFGIFQLIDRVLVIDGVGRQMNQVAGVVAEQTRADKFAAGFIGGKFAETEVIAGQMQLADVAALGRRANKFVARLFRVGRFHSGEGKLGI